MLHDLQGATHDVTAFPGHAGRLWPLARWRSLARNREVVMTLFDLDAIRVPGLARRRAQRARRLERPDVPPSRRGSIRAAAPSSVDPAGRRAVDDADATPERDPARPDVAMRERRRMALERLKVTEKPRRGPLVNLFGSKRVPFWDVQKGPAPVGYYVLAVVITLFVMLGLVMVLSASAQTEAARGRSPYNIFNRQLMWAGSARSA